MNKKTNVLVITLLACIWLLCLSIHYQVTKEKVTPDCPAPCCVKGE